MLNDFTILYKPLFGKIQSIKNIQSKISKKDIFVSYNLLST